MSVFLKLLFLMVVSLKVFAQDGFFVFDEQKKSIQHFIHHPNLSVDHPNSQGFELYGPEGTEEYLKMLGLKYVPILEDKNANTYPSPEVIEESLKAFATNYPNITKLFSIGKTNDGRNLWVMKISDNPNSDETEPEVKYIANMHGDEIVGRELMVLLINDILSNYGRNQAITSLVNNTEIFIMPSMNPDGASKKRRGNARQIDLNRNFPDFTTRDNQNTWTGREVETMAVMQFQAQRQFALSANFHGGAVVVNYPWDTTDHNHPLENFVIDLSLDYASKVDPMRTSTEFPRGIVNGYDWYEVNGGMQDWSYNWHGDLQVTIELSQIKWPPYNQIGQFYTDNRTALYSYLSNVHRGAGLKFTTRENRSGTVKIYSIQNQSRVFIGNFAFSNSEIYKVLPEGNYIFEGVTNLNETFSTEVQVKHNQINNNGNYYEI